MRGIDNTGLVPHLICWYTNVNLITIYISPPYYHPSLILQNEVGIRPFILQPLIGSHFPLVLVFNMAINYIDNIFMGFECYIILRVTMPLSMNSLGLM